MREKHEHIQKNSKVLLDPNIINSQTNIQHINFDYTLYAVKLNYTEADAKQHYMCTTLIPALVLRGETTNDIMGMSYTGKIELLQTYLMNEEYLSYIFTAIDKSNTTRDAALVLIEQCIPCSLHMDLQVTEKLIKILFQEGLNKCNDYKDFVLNVEDFINN